MSVTLATLDGLKSQLQSVKDLGLPVSNDLYSHLTEVYNRISQHHGTSKDAFEKFEQISALVKQNTIRIREADPDSAVNERANVITNQEALDMVKQCEDLLNERCPIVDPEQRQMLSDASKCQITDFADHAEIFEWAGIGFGENASLMINKSLKRLATTTGATSLRFFGKVFGTSKDYWVAQGSLADEEEVPSNMKQERRNKGANASVFWVTHDLMDDWIQLPECQPEHIQAARYIVKLMTGNLNAKVDSCPPFPGKERHLLRAQLARLMHTTEICPKGLYEIDEETTEQKYAEEFTVPGTEELKSLEAWCHVPQIILNAGRCTHFEPAGMEDDAKEEYLAKLNEEDKTEERYKAINEDTAIAGLKQFGEINPETNQVAMSQVDAWISKVVGDTQSYSRGESTYSYAVNVIQSMRWPGATTVAKGGKFSSIYIGDLVKRGDSCYNPTEPPEVPTDPSDPSDQPEPQGKDPNA